MSSQKISLKADEAINWFQKNLKNGISYGLSFEDYKMFEVFITSTLNDVDIKKQLLSSVLPKFFENLTSPKTNQSTINSQLSVMRLFMKYYGSTCGQFKSVIDKFTLTTVSEYFSDDNIMLKVTKYLALYPQCGGRGQQGVNHAEAWTNQFNDFIYCANYFLTKLYSNVDFFISTCTNDNYEGKFDIKCLNVMQIEQMTPKERYEKLTAIFIFFNSVLQAMLLSMFSTVKKFDTNKIIQFALSVISVTSEKLKATSTTEDVIALDSMLWKIHCSAIKTISALIKSCGRVLIPQGMLICRLLVQSLNITNYTNCQWVYGTNRSNQQQRILTYQVLRTWQAVAGSQSSLDMFTESLVSNILADIKYDKPSLSLIIEEQVGNRKRKSGALNAKIINQRDTIVMHDYHANAAICNQAHEILQLILNTMSSDLKQLQFKVFQSAVMGLALDIVKCQRPVDYPLPYYNDVCRINLFKSLLALVISPHPQCVTQTSVATRLFTMGLVDRNVKVKEISRSALAKIEHIIHPRNDTLFFPLENEVEVASTNQSALPENNSHFLKEIEVVNPVLSEQVVKTQIEKCNEIKQHIPLEPISVIPTINTTVVENKDVIKEMSLKSVREIEKISEIQTSNTCLINSQNRLADNIDSQQSNNKDIEPMDIECNSTTIQPDQSAAINVEDKDEEVIEMLNDFVDSD
ncbi:proline-, glutamic acid- and leucine-rich protein 1-like [Adelges cooleyi]|uniref:proline-, glutamic acid- and leucine-rich protein 1-like n=1 Tax=Adelges cooleyi TaxID=133065 RepID=UPI00217F9A35|nr:proline-, glutamic acid- and leucine-rich protein 1-like [Adelges cooleyi]